MRERTPGETPVHVLDDADRGQPAHGHDADREPDCATRAVVVAAVYRLRQREPLAPHDGQPEHMEAPSHVVAREEHHLIVVDDGAN
eukprot:11080303-Heterocapsa_arctica.AAC.1